MNKKDAVIVALATLCLTVTLFSIIPVMSTPVYDAWKDVNDDGVIDVKDWQLVKIAIPSMGDPAKNVTVTNWQPTHKVMHYISKENISFTSGSASFFNWSGIVPNIYAEGYSRITFYLMIENIDPLMTVRIEISNLFWQSDADGITVREDITLCSITFSGTTREGTNLGSTGVLGEYVYPRVYVAGPQFSGTATVSIDAYLRND